MTCFVQGRLRENRKRSLQTHKKLIAKAKQVRVSLPSLCMRGRNELALQQGRFRLDFGIISIGS